MAVFSQALGKRCTCQLAAPSSVTLIFIPGVQHRHAEELLQHPCKGTQCAIKLSVMTAHAQVVGKSLMQPLRQHGTNTLGHASP